MKIIKVILNYKGNKELKDLKVFSRGINRQIIKWLEYSDKNILKSIKDEKKLRPFTISYLFSDKKYYSFYLNILDDNLEKLIIKGMEELESEIIDLNYEKFELLGYETIKSSSLDDLKKISFEKALSKEFEIKFLSETCFSQKNEDGKRINLGDTIPSIKKIFRFLESRLKLLDEFTNFEEINFEEVLNIISNETSVKRVILGYNNKNKMSVSGFKGIIRFRFMTKDLEKKRYISLLTLLSEFCGIGKKTAFGMGQLKVNFL